MQLAALQIPAKGFLKKYCFCSKHNPTQLTGLEMENSSCTLVSRSTFHVTACLSSQELGHLIHFTSDPQLLRTELLLCLRICLQERGFGV